MGTAKQLLAGCVPSAWEDRWEGPEKPMSWMRAVVQRKKALTGWESKALRRNLLESPLDLSDLFTPGTFLNALRQQTARQLKRSMDELKLVSCWDTNGLKSAPLAVEIKGLLLQVRPTTHSPQCLLLVLAIITEMLTQYLR
jgi:dynein heavy chain 2